MELPVTVITIEGLYHSGKRLQRLRELQGLSEMEIASALAIERSELERWELTGVPQGNIKELCYYFEVSESLFSDSVTNQLELTQMVEGHLFPQNTDSLNARLQDNQSNKSTKLDLSSLGLSKIPDEIFQLSWLQELNLSDNKLIKIPCKILLLQQLNLLDVSNNLLQHIPGILDGLQNLEQLTFQGNPLQVQPQLLGSNMSFEAYKGFLTETKVTAIILEQITPDNLMLVEQIRDVIEITDSLVIIKKDEASKTSVRYAELNNLIYLNSNSDSAQLIDKVKPWLPLLQTLQVPFLVLSNTTTTGEQRLAISQSLFESFGDNAFLVKIVESTNEFEKTFNETQHKITYQNQLPIVKLERLILDNIGVYGHIEIPLNPDITVLIGLNGAGKSTILKALALATLGPEQVGSDNNTTADLLRIIGKEKNQARRQEEGRIQLFASVNGKSYENIISLNYNANTEKVEVRGSQFQQLFDKNGHMLNLMLGISEKRNTNIEKNKTLGIEASEPKTRDLLPIINGEEQACIAHFNAWLGNSALLVSLGEIDKQQTIDICFAIFSELMQEQIHFAGITKVDPLELWVRHQTPPQLIPLRLASQGYQAVMGWVGLIIQRMFEAYTKALQPLQQPSIIIIDEIDQLLHVKWQQNILRVLAKKFFPNTQWIITTHSPMVVTGLDSMQVIHLHQREGELVAEPNSVDLWLWQYGDIVRHLFEVPPLKPEAQEKQLTQDIDSIKKIPLENRTTIHTQELNKLQQQLEKTQKSRAFIDKVYAEQQKLQRKQQELSRLINQLTQQNLKG